MRPPSARRVVRVPAFGEEGDVVYASSSEDDGDHGSPVPRGARAALPDPGPRPPRPSLWSILKRAAGAPSLIDLPLPVTLCEPMTEVQRRCEIVMTGARLLDRAAAAPRGSVDRALALAAYVVTTYSVTGRTAKCLPPLLGETFEWGRGDADGAPPSARPHSFLVEMTMADKRAGAVASAWAGAGRGWRCAGDDAPRVALRGAGLEFEPGWRDRVVFDDGDVYEWGRATPTLVGLVSGRNAVSYSGRVVVAPAPDAPPPPPSAPPSLTIVLTFEAPSVVAALKGGDAVPRGVAGWLERADGSRVDGVALAGDWGSHLVAKAAGGADRDLWRATPPPPGAPFGFGGLAAALNDAAAVAAPGPRALPPTDSRRRPDVVALEAGDWDGAQAALDALQAADDVRARRGDHVAAWFRRVEACAPTRGGGARGDNPRGPLRWACTGEYWACRKQGDWGRCVAL